MEKYKKYIVKSNGVFNISYIDSNILSLSIYGYKPKYEGGCIAIIPNGYNFLLMGEDDDHYFDVCNLTLEELLIIRTILEKLDSGISVDIDYVKCISKQKYNTSKSNFFNKNYSIGDFKVLVEDRTPSAPLITITNMVIHLKLIFDVSHAKEKLKVINELLNSIDVRKHKIKKINEKINF